MALLGLPLAALSGLMMVVAALGNRTQLLPVIIALPLLGLGILGAIVATLVSFTRLIITLVRQSPPLLYHNDLTATVPRYYWSEDAGYALWLRLAYELRRAR